MGRDRERRYYGQPVSIKVNAFDLGIKPQRSVNAIHAVRELLFFHSGQPSIGEFAEGLLVPHDRKHH